MYRLQVINKHWFWEGMFLFIFLINIINVLVWWYRSTPIINEINIMIVFCWLVSGHRVSILHGVHYFSTLLRLQVRWISDFCRGWSPATRGAIRRFWHLQNPHQHHRSTGVYDQQAQTVQTWWPPSVEAGIQLKAIKPFSRFIFILTTALLSHKIFCLFFPVRNCLFAPEKEPTRRLRAAVTLGHSEADWKIS